MYKLPSFLAFTGRHKWRLHTRERNLNEFESSQKISQARQNNKFINWRTLFLVPRQDWNETIKFRTFTFVQTISNPHSSACYA